MSRYQATTNYYNREVVDEGEEEGAAAAAAAGGGSRDYRGNDADEADAAAAELHRRDDKKTVTEYIEALNDANGWLLEGPDSGFRHQYQLLEEEPLCAALAAARKQDTYVKVCSGLALTPGKSFLFTAHQEHLGFKMPTPMKHSYYHPEEGEDYLSAGYFGKAGRITLDLQASFADAERPLKTILLFDNSPGSCESFCKRMTKRQLRKIKGVSENVRLISVQYDRFAEMVTPELVADEYELYVIFRKTLDERKRLERERLLRGALSDSEDGTDYEDGFTSGSDEDDRTSESSEASPPLEDRKDEATD